MDSQMLLYPLLFNYSLYDTRSVYKWYNVRVPRKVHDVGSFLGVTDSEAAVGHATSAGLSSVVHRGYFLWFSPDVRQKRIDSDEES